MTAGGLTFRIYFFDEAHNLLNSLYVPLVLFDYVGFAYSNRGLIPDLWLVLLLLEQVSSFCVNNVFFYNY